SGEVTALTGTYTRAGGGFAGMQAVMGRLLQSPAMVFLIETGGASSGGRVRLTDFEVASPLSYLLTDTMPDAALLDAVNNGQLGSIGNVRTQVQRLLLTAGGRAKMNAFFGYYTQTDTMPAPRASAVKLLGM